MPVTVVDHPLVARHLAVLRDAATDAETFRRTLAGVAELLVYEALRDLATTDGTVTTPLEVAPARRLRDDVVLVAVLRAGLGMVDGALRVVPEARVGHLGMFRDEEALRPVGYYENLPAATPGADVVVLDPMLATGGSAIAAVARVRAEGAERIRLICLVAAPEGLDAFTTEHPDVPVWCAAVDRGLDDRGYIRPGLGDAGDRLYGTGH